MNSFEQVFDNLDSVTGWNTNSKLVLTLDFLQNHCADKLDRFEEVIDDIVIYEAGPKSFIVDMEGYTNNPFEKILLGYEEFTGWNEDRELSLALDFLDQYCPKKIKSFAKVITDTADQEAEFAI